MATSILLLSTTRAQAYCVNPGYAGELRAAFPTLHIPVYLAIGPGPDIENVQISQSDAARVLLEVIARHNETVVAPKLYFAGFVPDDFTWATNLIPPEMTNSIESWPSGIVVHGFSCDLLNVVGVKIHEKFVCNAGNRHLHACAYQHVNMANQLVGVVTLLPPHCQLAIDSNIEWSLDDSTQYDLAHTMLHELGHVLGFDHTNVAATDCGGISGNDPAGNYGVMRTTRGASLTQLRHWRRDDIDGFDALYGNDYPDLELAYWRDLSFPDALEVEDPSSLQGASVIRSGALGDAPNGMPQPMASVDASRRVVFASLAADGSVVEAPSVVDASALGVTVGSPDVAVGSDGQTAKVLVVWSADERSTSSSMLARWGIRDLIGGGGGWALSNGIAVTTSRLGAGFDPGSGLWMLTHLSEAGEPTVMLIDPDGALLSTQVLPLRAWDLSNPVCLPGADICTMLFSSSQFGGPNVGRVDFFIDLALPGVQVAATHLFGEHDVYGRSRLASAGVRLRAVAGRYRFELSAVDAEALPTPALPIPSMLGEWPVELGAYAGTHRLAMPIEVACGDGVLQNGEECDDGNDQQGDGCDGVCMLEPGDMETSGGTETGEGGILVSEPGCTCQSSPRGPAGPGIALFGLFGVVGQRRRA